MKSVIYWILLSLLLFTNSFNNRKHELPLFWHHEEQLQFENTFSTARCSCDWLVGRGVGGERMNICGFPGDYFHVSVPIKWKEKLLLLLLSRTELLQRNRARLPVSTADTISNSFVLRHYSCLRDDVDLHILPAYLYRLF